MPSPSEVRHSPWLLPLILLSLLAVATWLRIRHLGELGLVVDEGNQALAVRGMLEHGVPRVETGVLYLRGTVFLGIQTLVAALWGLDEFSLRIPSAVFGVGSVLATWALAVQLFDRRVALVATSLVAFSVWEIELSRYGRFYTAFQCAFLVSLLCFYRGFMLRERRFQIYFLLAALVAFSLHEFGVLLATCFLIPLPSRAYSTRQKLVFVLQSLGLAALWAVYRGLNTALETWLQSSPGIQLVGAETGAVVKTRLAFGIPWLNVPNTELLLDLADRQPWLLAGVAIVPLMASSYLLYRLLRCGDGWRVPLALLMVWAAFAHQFGLAGIAWLGYVAFFAKNLRSLGEPALRIAYAAIVWCLLFWLVFLSVRAGLPPKQLALTTFGYPNVLQYFLYWFVKGWPWLTAVVAAGGLALGARSISDRQAPMPLFVVGALVLPVVVTSFFQAFFESRYAFHLYPLLLMIAAWVMVEVTSRAWRGLRHPQGLHRIVATAALGGVVLVVAEDANPLEAWAVGSRTHRSQKDPFRSVISWAAYADFHQDQKTPALHVRTRVRPGDRVIAMGPPHAIGVYHYYLDPLDYALGRPQDASYYRKIEGKLVGWMTGSEILEDTAAIDAVREQTPGSVWFLADRPILDEGNPYYAPEIKEYVRSLVRQPDFVGLDGQTFAVELPPRGGSGSITSNSGNGGS